MEASSGLKNEFRKFGETVSVRGVSRILKSDVRILQIFWLFTVLTSSSILLWQLANVFTKFYRYPVATTLANDNQSPEFPDITLCNLYPVGDVINPTLTWSNYLNMVKAARTSITLDDLDSVTPNTNITTAIYNNMWESLESASIYFTNFPVFSGNPSSSLPTIFADCSYFTWDSTESDINCANVIKTVSNSKFFKCYTLHLNETFIRTVRSLALILYLNNFPEVTDNLISIDPGQPSAKGIKVILHSPGTRPKTDDGFDVGPGKETTIKLIPTMVIRLDKPYNPDGCPSQLYTDGSSDLYTANACIQICLQEQILNQCNCLSNSFKYSPAQLVRANSKKCGNLSLLDYGQITTAHPAGLVQLICVSLAKIDYNSCNAKCLVPCKENIYEYTNGMTPWPHLSHQLAFYRRYIKGNTQTYQDHFSPYEQIDSADSSKSLPPNTILKKLANVTLIKNNFLKVNILQKYPTPYVMTDKPQMTWETLLANIGGCLSLWLGITVMTLAELAELVYSVIQFGYEKNKSRTSTIIQVQMNENNVAS